jgi:hypothetical protein
MGKYIDNRTSASNRQKLKRKYSTIDAIGWDEKPRYYSEEKKRKSQAQARTDGSIQARMVAEREARLAQNNTES